MMNVTPIREGDGAAVGLQACPVCHQVSMALGQVVCPECHRALRVSLMECLAVVDEDQAFHLVEDHLVPALEARQP